MPLAAHHVGHGVGHCHRRTSAGVWDRFTERIDGGLQDLWRQPGGNFPRENFSAGRRQQGGTQIRLSREDLDFLRAEVPMIKRMSPEVNKQSLVAYGTRSNHYNIRGTYSCYQQIRHVEIGEGSFFGEQEDFKIGRASCRERG